jgi:surface polysaccharide O-acyltransferase-like enzyme
MKRIFELDIIRSIACMMVVAMHAPMINNNANGIFLSSLSYITAPCIGLFFMVSGALLLPCKEDDGRVFIKKRFSKIAFPTLFWSLFYITINLIKGEGTESLVKALISMPFSAQGNGVLWFMYTLMGLYLIIPIISRWLQACSKKEIEFYLILWSVTLCYPIFKLFLITNQTDTGVLYYCSGYAGYMLLGYYMKKYPDSIKWKVLLPTTFIAFIAPIACKIAEIKVDFYSMFWYLSIFVVIMCAAWFKIIMQTGGKIFKSDKIKNNIIKFSNLSFGIYLIHIFILRTVLWQQEWIINIGSYILQTAVCTLFTIILSYIICSLISRLPFSEYIIGYKKK